MKTIFYNFNLGKEINPLEGVDKFFVNPINPKLHIRLGLEKLMKDIKPKWGYDNGLPVFVYPLSKLDLGTCTVSFTSPTEGIIQDAKKAVLFHITGEYMVVDNVMIAMEKWLSRIS